MQYLKYTNCISLKLLFKGYVVRNVKRGVRNIRHILLLICNLKEFRNVFVVTVPKLYCLLSAEW